MSIAYAKWGNIEKALDIINTSLEDLEANKDNEDFYFLYTFNGKKLEYYANKLFLYKHSNTEDKYSKEIEQIKNEIIILGKEDNNQPFEYLTADNGKFYYNLFQPRTSYINFEFSHELSEWLYVTLAYETENMIN